MLVVVEDGDVAAFLELALDLKAARCSDILQIDAAEGAGDQRHSIDKFVYVFGLDTEREGVYPAKSLKQHAFTLHDGHTGLRADVA